MKEELKKYQFTIIFINKKSKEIIATLKGKTKPVTFKGAKQLMRKEIKKISNKYNYTWTFDGVFKWQR